MEEFHLLESAVLDLKKDIKVLQRSNAQAKINNEQYSRSIQKLEEALEMANQFRDAQNVHIGNLKSLSGKVDSGQRVVVFLPIGSSKPLLPSVKEHIDNNRSYEIRAQASSTCSQSFTR